MKNLIATTLLFVFSVCAFAAAPDFSKEFQGKSGCFILYDLNEKKLITQYNPARCAERIPPDSTFKIPLSLMAFDQNLISQATVFKWNGQLRDYREWNQDQTPRTWLKYSVVWVSQILAPQLGMKKIKKYLNQFHYGNQDFSGDPGMDNGLTHAWLNSSLKISADEQLHFIEALIENKLPLSKKAMTNTKENLYIETSENGWKLYGKTGTASTKQPGHLFIDHRQDAWFIGYTQNDNQTYIFILNFTDLQSPETAEGGGLRAKALTKLFLKELGAF